MLDLEEKAQCQSYQMFTKCKDEKTVPQKQCNVLLHLKIIFFPIEYT